MMTIKTRGPAFASGVVLLSCLWVGMIGTSPVLAFAPGEEAIESFSTKNQLSERLRTSLSRKFRRRNKSVRNRGDLAAFYSERDYVPVWVTDGRLNLRAREVRQELENASQFGLNPADYKLSLLTEDDDASRVEELAHAELMLTQAVLTYIRHARGLRFDQSKLSRFLDRKAKPIDATDKLSALAKADDPAAYLRAQHPHNAQFKALMSALASTKSSAGEPAKRLRIPRGPVLKPGMKQTQIALLRRRLGVPVLNNLIDERVYGSRLEKAVKTFQKSAGLKADGVIGLKTRFALNAPKQNRYKQIIANMERWRWMPRNLGATHIRVNIPEYKVRVTQNNAVIHTERVIVGKPVNKTPVFSDTMETVVFNPYWNVPQSIIWNEMHGRIPSGYEGGVRNGRMWIRQLPGPRNALGRVKFLFPNKHAVYLHDTPSKSLFNKTRRAFSHGCMRVRNPRRLAEVVLGMSGWSNGKVSSRWNTSTKQEVTLKTKIPVHVTYFTLWADKDGNLQSFQDVYGHDNRIFAAVTKGVDYAKSRFPEVRKRKIDPYARTAGIDSYEDRRRTNDWWFPSANSDSYWNGRNTRTTRNRRVRVYRNRQRRKQASFDNFFGLF